jgi:hypothetical protein
VINLKWPGIAAGTGLLLSLFVGIISGANFPAALIRAFIFGAVFFALAALAWFLINKFLPDLLSLSTGGLNAPGSRVDISLDDSQTVSAAIPGRGSAQSASPADEEAEDIGNIADLLNGNVQAKEAAPTPGYSGLAGEQAGPDSGVQAENAAPYTRDFGVSGGNNSGMDQNSDNDYTKTEGWAPGGGNLDSADALPDLDSMAGSFVPSAEEAAETTPDSAPHAPKRSGSGKGQSMGGDFNPKELASAIQTILSKD